MGCRDTAVKVVGLLIAAGIYSSSINANCYVATLSSEKLDTLHQALVSPSLERALYAIASTVRSKRAMGSTPRRLA